MKRLHRQPTVTNRGAAIETWLDPQIAGDTLRGNTFAYAIANTKTALNIVSDRQLSQKLKVISAMVVGWRKRKCTYSIIAALIRSKQDIVIALYGHCIYKPSAPDAKAAIDIAKQCLGAKSDTDLTKLLGGRFTAGNIARWRRNNTVVALVKWLMLAQYDVTVTLNGVHIYPAQPIPRMYLDFVAHIADVCIAAKHSGVLTALISYFSAKQIRATTKMKLAELWLMSKRWKSVNASLHEISNAYQLLLEAKEEAIEYLLANRQDFVTRLKSIQDYCHILSIRNSL
ncbi:hypothetical protein FACS1894103_5930 [Campylobacterota bacterium]|nr:hypothetical protein FACS1894103_5930 [Campylobacterota bacterium]